MVKKVFTPKKKKSKAKQIHCPVKMEDVTVKAKCLQPLEITTESVCGPLCIFLCTYTHMTTEKILSTTLGRFDVTSQLHCTQRVTTRFFTHPCLVVHPGEERCLQFLTVTNDSTMNTLCMCFSKVETKMWS